MPSTLVRYRSTSQILEMTKSGALVIDDKVHDEFHATALKEYAAQWLTWHLSKSTYADDSRVQEQSTNAFKKYSPIVGLYTPWFHAALKVISDYNAEACKPIATLFLAAALQTLNSLDVFQSVFRNDVAMMAGTFGRDYILNAISWRDRKEPNLPLLFDATANGYEHAFVVYVKVIDEFKQEFGRYPQKQELSSLIRQSALIMRQEALLSRRENIAFEVSFLKIARIFSFQKTERGLRLTVRPLEPSAQSELEHYIEENMGAQEQAAQKRKSETTHLGCPAAFARHEKQTVTSFVMEHVGKALYTAIEREPEVRPEAIREERVKHDFLLKISGLQLSHF